MIKEDEEGKGKQKGEKTEEDLNTQWLEMLNAGSEEGKLEER